MARKTKGQLTFLTAIGLPEDVERTSSHLERPLSKEEQRHFGRMYVEHRGLIRLLGHKLGRQFHMMRREDVYSSIDIAFLKACRAWDPVKGKFSTILTSFAVGECKHFVRDQNFALRAPGKVRQLGQDARRLLDEGFVPVAVCRMLSCDAQQLKEALLATAGLAHEQKGFSLHICPRPTPWEVLEADEMAAS